MCAGGICAANELPGDERNAQLCWCGRWYCRAGRLFHLVPSGHRRTALVPGRDPDLQARARNGEAHLSTMTL
jgi:hypothetical protein